ncbi:MAG: hypothetical protein ABL989_11845 [Gammaproteobacteria bacterium]
MNITIETDDGTAPQTFDIQPEQTVQVLIERIDAAGQVDGHSLLEETLGVLPVAALTTPLGDRLQRLKHLKTHRVCVELHFETDTAKRWFPTRARWAAVHRWGCRQFQVAANTCAHLELRLATPDGPPVNEAQPIGQNAECVTAWLIKPGAEPNGR